MFDKLIFTRPKKHRIYFTFCSMLILGSILHVASEPQKKFDKDMFLCLSQAFLRNIRESYMLMLWPPFFL